ncbi:efflux transporter outer membrane subunit [Sphingobium sp. H39-3-25]|uniref:efflux transporter outer membrane subunit n=1 Tax=Sphingobium arseniciresistens TaxID=3030834 RepID=UPI0023B9AB9A|nr:efflux transporter outer membrane subunit [Sphingobium arseniciresistens]
MRHYTALPLVFVLLAGCTVGPNYAGPPPAAPAAMKATTFVRPGDAPVSATTPPALWWKDLHDPVLDDLIAKALAENNDLRASEARLRQARAALGLERANGAPNVNASAVYAHARIPGLDLGSGDSEDGGSEGSGGGGSSDLNLYNLGFDASWEIDLFGGQRRAVEAARADLQGAEASLADVQVSLSAEVAKAYLDLRERQQRIALSARSVAMQQEMLELTRERYARGTASALEVAQLESDLGNTRAQSTPLNAERDAYLNALAVLTGQEPGALDAMLAADAPIPLPPASVAIGDPGALIQHRPDVRQAERKLAAQTAKIGQAEAARFPSISFMGLIGIGGTKISDLGNLDDFAAIAAPQLSWNFLDFGRNSARIGQANALRDEAEARYRGAVLAALKDAEDSLARFRDRRAVVASLARTRDTAERAEQLTSQRYQAGTTTRIALLDAQRQQIAAEQQLLSARSALTADFVAIQKALGLGWEETPRPTSAAAAR